MHRYHRLSVAHVLQGFELFSGFRINGGVFPLVYRFGPRRASVVADVPALAPVVRKEVRHAPTAGTYSFYVVAPEQTPSDCGTNLFHLDRCGEQDAGRLANGSGSS